MALLAPGLAVIELAPPSDLGDEPWALVVKAGEVATTDTAWVKRPLAR